MVHYVGARLMSEFDLLFLMLDFLLLVAHEVGTDLMLDHDYLVAHDDVLLFCLFKSAVTLRVW